MSQNRTTIEINGQHYDAQTGRLLSGSAPHNPANGKSLDGVARHQRAHLSETPKQHIHAVKHAPHAADSVHHTTHKSATLQRRLVKKPAAVHKDTARPAPIHPNAAPAASKAIHHKSAKLSRHGFVDGSFAHKDLTPSTKVQRAHTVARSHAISRFGTLSSEGVIKRVAPLKVRRAPHSAHETIERPHHEAPLPILRAEPDFFARSAAETSNLLERSIELATAHQATPHRKTSHRRRVAHKLGIHPGLVNIGAAAFVGLLLIGFFAYQNTTKIAMSMAAHRSGMAVSAPTNIPSGYRLGGPIKYATGMVAFTYTTPGADKEFTLSQQTSEWTSSTLFSNMFADGTVAYQTLQSNGLTIYTYGQGNATWVSGGLRYDITGDAGLTSDQITRLATSL